MAEIPDGPDPPSSKRRSGLARRSAQRVGGEFSVSLPGTTSGSGRKCAAVVVGYERSPHGTADRSARFPPAGRLRWRRLRVRARHRRLRVPERRRPRRRCRRRVSLRPAVGPALGIRRSANPDARGTLPKAIAAVNGLAQAPDFVVFTGDLTHTTDDPKERRVRMAQVRDQIGKLNVKTVHLMPGEHDAALDRGEAFQEVFGKTHYTFDHKGVHFIVLDNVSDPGAVIGDEQLGWLASDLSDRPRNVPIVVLTHRPLFDLYPQWDWATRDASRAIALLEPFEHVTVFYGHIHQEHHQMTGRIAHHAARSLIFPLPPPGSQPKRTPIAWDAAAP